MKNRGPSGSNERIGVAVIGLGPLAGVEAVAVLRDRGEASQVRLAAVCDLHPGRLAAGQRRGQLKASDTSRDYRRVLERPDVDAVVVATPDITHARICLDALDAGKHVLLRAIDPQGHGWERTGADTVDLRQRQGVADRLRLSARRSR